MYDTSRLRGRIVERFGSLKEFEKIAKCSHSFLSQYMNGKKTLNQTTMDRWIDLLEISDMEIRPFFFLHLQFTNVNKGKGNDSKRSGKISRLDGIISSRSNSTRTGRFRRLSENARIFAADVQDQRRKDKSMEEWYEEVTLASWIGLAFMAISTAVMVGCVIWIFTW